MINKTNYVTAIDGFWKSNTNNYLKWADAHGISYNEFVILYRLGRNKSVTQKEICLDYGIPKQSVSYGAKILNEKGIIEFRVSNTDRRDKDMVLTKAGKNLVKKCVLPLFRLEEETFEKIGAERIEKMLETSEMFVQLIGEGMDREL